MDEMPPGYRFYPTEEELICFYLHKKLQASPTPDLDRVIPVLHIYDFNPWDLPQYAGELCHGDPEQWFFFNPRQEREARGGRPNRLTTTGYWKATGSPSYVYSKDSRVIGLKRTMVFYRGRAPAGRKTQWKMNEYKAIQFQDQQQLPSSSSSSSSAAPTLRQEVSLCRVYIRSKCLRAFDRRPSAELPVIGESSATHQAQSTPTTTTVTPGGAGGDQATSTTSTTFTSHDDHQLNHNQNPTLTTEIITSSPGNTSSSGGATPMETDDADAVNSDPLWDLGDLDQLNWFLNSMD